MKKKATFTIMFFAASLMAGGALAAEGKYGQQKSTTGQQQQTSPAVGADQQQSSQQQQKLVSAQDLQDFKVMDAQNEEIGQISQVLIDVQSGRVGYAIIGEGGILGMGEGEYIVPFAALQQGQEEQSLRVSMQKDQLRAAPEGDVQTLTRQLEQEIHQFYGVSPYWEESGIQQRQQQPGQQPGVQQRDPLEMRDQQRQQQQTPGTRAQ